MTIARSVPTLPRPGGFVATLVVLLFSSVACAGTSAAVISVDPPLPSTYEVTRMRLEGGLYSGCRPQLLNLQTDNEDIVATYQQPSSVCPDAFFPWDEQLELGVLPAGTYRVTVYLFGPGPTAPSSELVAQAEFDVAERVGVSLHGLLTSKIVCKNRSTGQRVVVRDAAPIANCEAAGLSVDPGDRVAVRVLGSVPVP